MPLAELLVENVTIGRTTCSAQTSVSRTSCCERNSRTGGTDFADRYGSLPNKIFCQSTLVFTSRAAVPILKTQCRGLGVEGMKYVVEALKRNPPCNLIE